MNVVIVKIFIIKLILQNLLSKEKLGEGKNIQKKDIP